MGVQKIYYIYITLSISGKLYGFEFVILIHSTCERVYNCLSFVNSKHNVHSMGACDGGV